MADRRDFYAGGLGISKAGLSLNDLKYRFFKKNSGLAVGTVNDHELAFIRRVVGATPQLNPKILSISNLESLWANLLRKGSRNLRALEEGGYLTRVGTTKNLAKHPNAETGTITGWQPATGATVTATTEDKYRGNYSYKVVTPGAAVNEGISQMPGDVVSSGDNSFAEVSSVWVKAPAGATLIMALEEYNGSTWVKTAGTSNFVGTGSWQQVQVSGAKNVAANVMRVYIRTITTPQAITLYVDCMFNSNTEDNVDYFDGSDPGGNTAVVEWDGLPNESSSSLYSFTYTAT